jgi:Fe-S-cluster containining protein
MPCNRCGICCNLLCMPIKGMTAEQRRVLAYRGLVEDKGFVLIPHRCKHFTDENTCDTHEAPDRPMICRKFHGQKQIGPWQVYVPPGCGYLEETNV